jgi:hypothetical protein
MDTRLQIQQTKKPVFGSPSRSFNRVPTSWSNDVKKILITEANFSTLAAN